MVLPETAYASSEPSTEVRDDLVENKFDKIVDAIQKVETNYGKDLSGRHGKCVAIGKTNSYSYAPGKCYDSEEELRAIVIDHLERKTKTMTLDEVLCRYGGAGKVSTCSYSQIIKSLN